MWQAGGKREGRCRREQAEGDGPSTRRRTPSPGALDLEAAGLVAPGASSSSSIPTWPRAMRDSISETQRFASALVGCRDGL